MECFLEIKKMVDKVKMVGKHLEIVSQTNQRMRDPQAKIEDLEEWRNRERMFLVAFQLSKVMTSVYIPWLLPSVRT